MRSETIEVRTGGTARVHDLTSECEQFVTDEPDGLLSVFVPHATAGLAILETGAGSDEDLLGALEHLLPRDERWLHRHGSAGHGRDHVLPALVAPSITVDHRPGHRRTVAARHLAVDLPRRHERRQLRPDGATELPGRLSQIQNSAPGCATSTGP